MIVYHSTKKGFVNDVFNGTIADDIDHAFYSHLGRHTSPNEKNIMEEFYDAYVQSNQHSRHP